MSKRKIIVGHYGSGKSEFCINYALKMKEKENKVSLIDLDIVNPYFRSRQRWEMLEENGIEVTDSSIGHSNGIDIPAISSRVYKYLETDDYFAVFDVGGDDVGARVLSRFRDKIKDYDMYIVINANRPDTDTSKKAIEYIEKIEYTSHLKINGLINNTHMLNETGEDDILKGYTLCREIEKEKNIPIIYNTINNCLKTEEISSKIDKIFTINSLKLRPEWL